MSGREMSELQRTVLGALRKAGGKSTVYSLIRDGFLPQSTAPDGRAYRDGKRVGYGLAFAALERRGIVESVYGMMEQAGASKVWAVTEAHGGPGLGEIWNDPVPSSVSRLSDGENPHGSV